MVKSKTATIQYLGTLIIEQNSNNCASIFLIFLSKKKPFARTPIPRTVKFNKWSRQ